jgi:hypothetical protein
MKNEYVPGLMQVKFKKGAVTKLDNKLSVNSIKSDSLKNYLAAIGLRIVGKSFQILLKMIQLELTLMEKHSGRMIFQNGI